MRHENTNPQPNETERETTMGIVLLLVFGLLLIAGPVTASALGHSLGILATTVLLVCGVALTILAGILATVTHLYHKTKANEALVRTGTGGMKVIKDGGVLVISFMHTLVRVPLGSRKLVVAKDGKNALLTKDMLRADVTTEFYIRVQPDLDSIQQAARSCSEYMGDWKLFNEFIETKLVSALRSVATTMNLEALNRERDQFVAEVTKIVKFELQQNGFTLEGVTISKLDQTDLVALNSDHNIFDAQGAAVVARIVQAKKTERNQLEREGEQARTSQDVTTKKAVLDLLREQAEAEATQQSLIAVAQAQQTQATEQEKIATTKAIDLADIDKQQAIEVAKRTQQQAIEVAERTKQAAIAQAEAGRTAKEAELATAEAARETERQAITTVKVTAEAERAKTTQVIGAEATAQTAYVQAQKAADGVAYALQKNAEGQKAAADAEAEAITKKANAESTAAEARARGQKAEAMVPVDVASAQVDVEQRKVNVLLKELEARAEHGSAMQDFELAKLRITKEAEIRIEGAKAMAQFSSSISAQVFGSPEDVGRMSRSFMDGMTLATKVDGFFAAASNDTKEIVQGAGATLGKVLNAAATRLSGSVEDSGSASPVNASQAAPAKVGVANGGE